MSALRPSMLFIGVLLLYSVFSISASWTGKFSVFGMIPTAPATKPSNDVKNKGHCAIECARAKTCQSFAFGSNECFFWDAKYMAAAKMGKENASETLMKNKSDYAYYYLTKQPEATEMQLFEDELTFEEAEKSCQKLYRGSLVTIHNQKTQKKAEALMEKSTARSSAWIGINGTIFDSGQGGRTRAGKYDLRWMDGFVFSTASNYDNLQEWNPNGNGKACLAMVDQPESVFKFGTWVDDPCSTKKKYICQYARE